MDNGVIVDNARARGSVEYALNAYYTARTLTSFVQEYVHNATAPINMNYEQADAKDMMKLALSRAINTKESLAELDGTVIGNTIKEYDKQIRVIESVLTIV